MKIRKNFWKKTEIFYFRNKLLVWVFIIFLMLSLVLTLFIAVDEKSPFWPTLFEVMLDMLTYQTLGQAPVSMIGVTVRGLISLSTITITGLLTGYLASVFTGHMIRRYSGMEVPHVTDHTIVCGWNDGAQKVVESCLGEKPDTDIILICKRNQAPMAMKKVHWLNDDFTDISVLKKASVELADTAIILADTESTDGDEKKADWQTIVAVLAIETLKPDVHTAAELINPINKIHLENAQVDEIVIRGDLSASILSRIVHNKGLSKIINRIVEVNDGVELYKIDCPEWAQKMTFDSLLDLLRERRKMLLIGFESKKGEIVLSPMTPTSLNNAKYLYVLSENKQEIIQAGLQDSDQSADFLGIKQ